MKHLVWVAVLCAACGARPAGDDGPDSTAATDSLAADSVIDTRVGELPPFPEYPDRRGGFLTARAAGATDFEEAWRARAQRCTSPAMLFLIAEGERSGGSVLLELPESTSLVGQYPVKFADGGAVPEAPAAQLGFQFFDERGASAYQASDGAVGIYGFEARVSGRFQIEVRQIQTEQRARVSGVFHNVDVAQAPADWCTRAGQARDSLAREG